MVHAGWVHDGHMQAALRPSLGMSHIWQVAGVTLWGRSAILACVFLPLLCTDLEVGGGRKGPSHHTPVRTISC